jgi:hypothetical protein
MPSWRVVVVAVAAASSGCWSAVCIDADRDVCADDVGSIWIDSSQEDVVNGVRCDVRLDFTTCRDQGYTYPCHGGWSKGRC